MNLIGNKGMDPVTTAVIGPCFQAHISFVKIFSCDTYDSGYWTLSFVSVVCVRTQSVQSACCYLNSLSRAKVLLTGPQQRQSVWQWAHFGSVCVCSKQSLKSSPPSLVHPYPSSTSHLLTEWQPTLAYRNATYRFRLACRGSHQSSCRTCGPAAPVRQNPNLLPSPAPPVHTLFSHLPPLGPFLHPCISELLEWIHQLSLQRSKASSNQTVTQKTPS